MKAVGYCRVSTQGQVNEGVSMDAQESKIRAWADLNGYDQIQILCDAGISGKRADNRAGLQDALASVANGDALVVYSLSRLARSTKDTLEIADILTKKGSDLVSLSERIDTTSAAGKMVFRMMAILSEFERDQISERTRGALAHKKSKSELIGAVPYGYQLSQDGRLLTEYEVEKKAIAQAKELRQAGLSLRAIAVELAERGVHARSGKSFDAKQISRMVAASV
jgi:site-specific DNA recombinase